MRYLSLIIALLSIACGEQSGREGNVRHLYSTNQEDEQGIIFAAKQPNGQHCFYQKKVANDTSLAEISKDRQVVSKLAQGSELLTPRSLYYKDVRGALEADSKNYNFISHLLYNPFSIHTSLACFVSSSVFLVGNAMLALASGPGGAALSYVTTGKIAVVSCGLEMAFYASAIGLFFKGFTKEGHTTNKLTSKSMHSTTADTTTKLHKIFMWLESRDAMQCPAKLELPIAAKATQKDNKEK